MRTPSFRAWALNLALALSLVLTLVAGSGISFRPAPTTAQNADTLLSNRQIVASAARTATGTGSTFCGLGQFKKFAAQLDVTAASGTTPTLDVTWQHSIDGGTNWFTVVAFAQKTAAGEELKVESDVEAGTAEVWGDCMRAIWTIGGTTPSFTFAVDIQAQS